MIFSEYDAFGPWIYEIDEEHRIPPLYEKYYKQAETPLMLIKIPRNIERRKANPDMHLYDAVIGLFETYMYIYKRDNNSVIEKKVYYKSIQAIKDIRVLLKGELIIYFDKGTEIIDYNTVSDDIITKLIWIIKMKSNKQEVDWLKFDSIPYSLKNVEHLYVNLINELKYYNKEINLVAYQPAIKIKYNSNRFIFKVINAITSKMFYLSSAYTASPYELIVLDRETLAKREKDRCKYSYLYLSYDNIKYVNIEENNNSSQVRQIVISTKDYKFAYLFESNNSQINRFYQKFNKIVVKAS